MTFISYAQNFEDVMLWRALKHIENGFYIDIGAAWPNEHSVTKSFYDRGWHGINVEPNPDLFALEEKDRGRDINLQLAIGDESGSLEISVFKDTGLSTLNSDIADQHVSSGFGAEKITVNVATLAQIWMDHVPVEQVVHFLKVDVEGFEEAALRGNDWTKNRPWVVVVEATKPMSQEESYASWEPILLNARYHFAYADGLNRFYVSEEHEELLPSFKYPPNVFDGFVLSQQEEAGQKATSAEARALSAEARALSAEARALSAEARTVEIEAELTAILNSRSWKITVPLRWLSGIVRKLKPRAKRAVRYFIGKTVFVGMKLLNRYPKARRHVVSLLSRFPGVKEKLRVLVLHRQGISFNERHSFMDLGCEASMDLKSLSPTAQRYYRVLQSCRKKNAHGGHD